jgi:hypothetical protein
MGYSQVVLGLLDSEITGASLRVVPEFSVKLRRCFRPRFARHPIPLTAMSFLTVSPLRILPFLGLHAVACFLQVHVFNSALPSQPAPPSAQQVLTRVPVLNHVLPVK